MFGAFIQVALGGALGAVLRYGCGLLMIRSGGGTLAGLPLPIVTVNVLGSFLMGAFVVWSAHRGLSHLSPLVMTGVLGGFTTFSAFSLETVTLIERGQLATAAVYVLLSVGLSIAALMMGVAVTRGVLA
ncbi:fluoride efflux transporter CrcB [Shimia ponticola]|uniref:fluoride efflux transporter CrcB n=1 Tax=Shimia ponticola TaxID=2582893 RepID=UPI0011BE4AC0|nr:fluoride efflux transporter CrcB [Shimia ponticola]